MKALLLDRDGVINHDSDHYIKSPTEWQPIAGSLEAIARLSQAGVRVYVATNQSGLGRGLFDYDAFFAMQQKFQRLLAEKGGRIEAVAFAPEHPDAASDRRKPAPGMLKDLSRRAGFVLEETPFVGDSWSDLLAAQAAGCPPVLVKTGNGAKTWAKVQSDFRAIANVQVFEDLAGFVDSFLSH
jgi:D-glycero-D-manno-heptose 1,7-bisphosphate phosphatase